MKKTEKKVLIELLKDATRSDRAIAKVLGVSQPTVTRIKNKLVKEGIIRGFNAIPDLAKLGYEIMAITCVKMKRPQQSELREKAERWWEKYPNVIFVSAVEGMGMTGVSISLHKSFTDYQKLVAETMVEWRNDVMQKDAMLISLTGGGIIKPLSLEYLMEQEETPEE